MNLGQIKDKTVHIIREYSNNGDKIGLGENADYLNSIPSLVSDAQIEISNKRPIIRSIKLEAPISTTDKYIKYAKPSLCKRILYMNRNDCRFTDFEETYNEIWIPKNYTGSFELYYSKIPKQFDAETDDSTTLEIDEDLQYIACYKAAAGIVIDENPDMYELLKNEYDRLLYTIQDIPGNEKRRIETVYGAW